MLDDLHRGDEIEGRARQRRELARVILDREPLPRRMVARGGDILRRRIDARHRRAHSRQRLGEQPGAAADVDRGAAGQRKALARVDVPMRVDLVADIGEADRIEFVQHRRRPVRIPPVGGERAEMGGFVRIDRLGAHAPRFGTVPSRVQEILSRARVRALAIARPLA